MPVMVGLGGAYSVPGGTYRLPLVWMILTEVCGLALGGVAILRNGHAAWNLI